MDAVRYLIPKLVTVKSQVLRCSCAVSEQPSIWSSSGDYCRPYVSLEEVFCNRNVGINNVQMSMLLHRTTAAHGVLVHHCCSHTRRGSTSSCISLLSDVDILCRRDPFFEYVWHEVQISAISDNLCTFQQLAEHCPEHCSVA